MLRLFPPLRFLSVKPLLLCCSAPHRDVEASSEQSFIPSFQTDEGIESVFIQENWGALFGQLSPDDTERLLTSPAFSHDDSLKAEPLVISSDMMDRILSVKPHSEKTATIWCCMVCRALDSVNHISLNQVESIRETLLINVLPLVSTQVDIFWWCSIVSNSANKCSNGPSVLGVPAVRDALIQLHDKLSHDHSVRAWLACIPILADSNEQINKSHHCFATRAMREAVMHVGHLVTSHDAAYWWCGCVSNLGIFDRKLFARRDVCELLMNHHSLILTAVRGVVPMRQVYITKEKYVAKWCAAAARATVECEETRNFFATEAVRDALLSFLSFVASPPSALWWCGVLLNVVEKNPRAQRIFGSVAMRDALLEVEPFATGHDASRTWLGAISRLCADNDTTKNIFVIRELCDAVLRKAREIPADEKTKSWCATWCLTVTHLVRRSQKGMELFAVSETRHVLLLMLTPSTCSISEPGTEHRSLTNVWCCAWCVVVANLVVGFPLAHHVFATTTMIYALIRMSRLVTTSDAVVWWCSVVGNLAAPTRFYGQAAELSNALLRQVALVTTADACRAWTAAVSQLCRDNVEMQKEFVTPDMRDALVAVRKHATTPVAARWWCSALSSMVATTKSVAPLFSLPEFCDALITLVTETDFATDDAFSGAWCAAVSILCSHSNAARRHLATPAMRHVLLTVHSFVRSTSTAAWWCYALSKMVDENLETKAMFGTTEMRDALVSLQPRCKTKYGCRSWCAAVAKLCVAAPANQQLFRTPVVRDALLRQARIIKESSQVIWWCAAVSNLVKDREQELFATREMHDALVSLASLDLDSTSAWRWVSVLYSLTYKNTASQRLFATVPIRDGLLKCSARIQSEDVRRTLTSVTLSLAFSSPAVRSCFEDALCIICMDKT